MAISLSCVVCEKTFLVPPSRAKSAKACSNACGNVVRARSQEKRVTLQCKHCAKGFQVPECHASRRLFCSLPCRDDSPARKRAKSEASSMARNAAWKGGVTRQTDGYLLERSPKHPLASNGYVMQHRLVVERVLRERHPEHPFLIEIEGASYLSPELDVHHINSIRDDNREENLIACTPLTHSHIHHHKPLKAGSYWPLSLSF